MRIWEKKGKQQKKKTSRIIKNVYSEKKTTVKGGILSTETIFNTRDMSTSKQVKRKISKYE